MLFFRGKQVPARIPRIPRDSSGFLGIPWHSSGLPGASFCSNIRRLFGSPFLHVFVPLHFYFSGPELLRLLRFAYLNELPF